MPENNLDLAQLRALHSETTPGTWEMAAWFDNAIISMENNSGKFSVICGKSSVASSQYDYTPNAMFITAIHNALPAILDRMEAAERERDELAYELGRVSRAVDNPELYRVIHESLQPARDKRDARQQALGAAEAWETVSAQACIRGDASVAAYADKEAARLRREAGE